MPSDDHPHTVDRLAHFVQRNSLWMLLACYALAMIFPGPGRTMRGWEWPLLEIGRVPLSLSLFLLAVMLFSAALLTDLRQVRIVSRHPLALAMALAAVWLGPSLLVLVADRVVPWAIGGQSTAGLLVALALVATMPVANSSVGWTQNAGGNLGLALSLVVLSIMLSPWVTPHLLSLLGMSLSAGDRAQCEALVNRFSGLFFIIWVILPTAAGMIGRRFISPERVDRAKPWLILASTIALLLLNYINSAFALPKVNAAPQSLRVATAILAVALSLVGIALGWLIAWTLRLRSETRAALMFGLSMKHTGLALILAEKVLADQPLAILMIVLATLTQHLIAGVVDWRVQRTHITPSPHAIASG